MKKITFLLLSVFIISCIGENKDQSQRIEKSYDERESIFRAMEMDTVTKLDTDFREFRVLDSENLDVELLWKPFNKVLDSFAEPNYERLKPMILEQDMPVLTKQVYEQNFSFEELTLFYLYRIRKFDRLNDKSLNSVISINSNVINDAKLRDKQFLNKKMKHAIFGMPILLKDNINAVGSPTTAGAVVLKGNEVRNSYITEQLEQRGAIILGKANLSEWAYFFCGDCPSGYSAIGGQTLNPYGRRTLDTGGSSSGSGVAVAANFCAGAVGSETSGSILSPSSQNSIVGLKPTIGVLSRTGIVPISSTLDTPGPMTRTVTDNAILLDAMLGMDVGDSKTKRLDKKAPLYQKLNLDALKGIRLGAFNHLMEDPLYKSAIDALKKRGADIVNFDQEELDLPDFRRLLNLEMKRDLPKYILGHGNPDIGVVSVRDVIAYNKKDSALTAPYGQRLFNGIVADTGSSEDLKNIHHKLQANGKLYFDKPMKEYDLAGFVSINNYHAGYAAVAEYPALTVPMGYTDEGAPKGLTFISTPMTEARLLNWAYAYEQATKKRETPEGYN